jgi:tetratricopeptide (TPR) repeat protein
MNAKLTRGESVALKIESNTLDSFPENIFSGPSSVQQVIFSEIGQAVISAQAKSETLLPYTQNNIVALQQFNSKYNYFFQTHVILARLYDAEGLVTKNKEKFLDAEKEYKIALTILQDHQEILYPYAFNMFYRGDTASATLTLKKVYDNDPNVPASAYFYGMMLVNGGEKKYDEALSLIESALDKKYQIPETGVFTDVYGRFFLYYYTHKNKDLFLTVVARLAEVENPQKQMFKQIQEYVTTTGQIPKLNIEQR